MNACCNNESIFLFEKLSHFPFLDVHKHWNANSLVLNALLSEKWETVIRQEGMRLGSVWNIKITQDEVYFRLKFLIDNNENLEICFKEDSSSEVTEDVWVHQVNHLVTVYHKTNQHLEDTCSKAFKLLLFLFPPFFYDDIIISLGSRSPDFPFRFLLQLPRLSAGYVDLNADQEVDGEVLLKFLGTVRSNGRSNLKIGVRIKNLVKPVDQIFLGEAKTEISDARFLSIECLKQTTISSSKFGQNDFTSQDFNLFLRSWMGRATSLFDLVFGVVTATFDIREDQNIKMEEVMEGLNPHVGLPRIRDRWRLEYPHRNLHNLYPTATDLGNGWDIRNIQGHIGTVLLEPNRLTFYNWSSISFKWQDCVELAKESIENYTWEIECLVRKQERMQKKVAAGQMELFPDQKAFLEQYPENKRLQEQCLAAARDKVEKLLTVWNDDAVYVSPPNRNRYYPHRTFLLVGSADIGLDSIPLSLNFSRTRNRRQTEYTKIEGNFQIEIVLITDVASIKSTLLALTSGTIYAFSDADSFDHLSQLNISLRETVARNALKWQIRKETSSMLLHLPLSGSKNQPDSYDVESFQRTTFSDIFEFDPNSPTDSGVKDFFRERVYIKWE